MTPHLTPHSRHAESCQLLRSEVNAHKPRHEIRPVTVNAEVVLAPDRGILCCPLNSWASTGVKTRAPASTSLWGSTLTTGSGPTEPHVLPPV